MDEKEPARALNLDLDEQQSFIQFYRRLPEKAPCTIRIFCHGEFYTIHDEDVKFAEQQAKLAMTVKLMGEAPKLSYMVLNKKIFETFLRDSLLVLQQRVEVFVKDESSKGQMFSVQYKGSPGNLSQFEDILFNEFNVVCNSVVMGVKFGKNKTLSVACINTTECLFYLSDFLDNEYFTELESLVAQVCPKECIIPTGDSPELEQLRKILQRNGVLVNQVKKADFSHQDASQDLNKLLYFADGQVRNYLVFPDLSNDDTVASLLAVANYLDLVRHDSNHNQFKVSSLDVHRFVRLDNAAISALNLFPQAIVATSVDAAVKHDSIFGILDVCVTVQGRRLLQHWLRKPLRDLNKVNERLEVVEALMKDAETRTVLSTASLRRLPDLIGLSRKLGSKKATLADLYKIFQAIDNIIAMTGILRQTDNKIVKSFLVEPLTDYLNDLEKYQSMIEQTFDMDLVAKGQYLLTPTINDELKELYKEKRKIEQSIESCLRSVSSNLGLDDKAVKLDYTDQYGYCFRVTKNDEGTVRDHKGYTIVDGNKSGVRFRNSKLEELNDANRGFKESYEEIQSEIAKEVFDVASGYADAVRNLNDSVATVDVLVAFATVSVDAAIPFVRPKMLPMGSGVLKIKKVRHPCLEKQNISIIPNDIEMLANDDGHTSFTITGPNMGGKSTYIRSIGVCVLLAHIGCPVPCESAEISIVDCILARIGAEDCELMGMSTFMLEMVETNAIIRSATSNSLVIIDELGRGTSTYDGYGIAASVFEYLSTRVKCFTLFATHFHEITYLAENISNIENLHVSALITENTITPLYQVREGSCDKSYGIHCARIAEYPQEIIDFAKKHQQGLEVEHGYKHIKNFHSAVKKQIVEGGDKILNDNIKALNTIDIDSLTDAEILKLVEDSKTQSLNTNNAFIKGLIEGDDS